MPAAERMHACARERHVRHRRAARRAGANRSSVACRNQREPDALAPPAGADSIHAVVPVARAEERQTVRADREARIERERAVRVERLGRRRLRSAEQLLLAGRERAALEKGDGLIEQREVLGHLEIMRDHVRQPDAVVRHARLDALVRDRQPPVLHVARPELASRGTQDVLAGDGGPRDAKRHHILQLIAIAPGAARLVKRGTRPQPASERLIEQPAVQEHVHRPVRRLYLDRAERLLPELRSTSLNEASRSAARYRAISSSAAAPGGLLAEKEHDLRLLAGLQGEARLQRAARVKPRAHAIRQGLGPEQRRGLGERAVSAQEFRTVRRSRSAAARPCP